MDRYELSTWLNPGKSQGRPNEKLGLEAHRSITAYPSAFSQMKPLSRINLGRPRLRGHGMT